MTSTDPLSMSIQDLRNRYIRAETVRQKLVEYQIEKNYQKNAKKINCLALGAFAAVFFTGFVWGRLSTYVI